MTERIDWPDIQWTVLIDVHENECVANFRLVEWIVVNGEAKFRPAGQSSAFPATDDPKKASVDCEGSVKWDGCVNYGTDSDCNLHACGRDDIVRFTQALLRACDAAFERIPKRDPEMWTR